MSSPPKYQPLSQHDSDGDLESKNQHMYLAGAAVGESSNNTSSSNTQVRTVIYQFIPRWPMECEKQEALGVLYPSREATTRAIMRVFPDVQGYGEDRVQILTDNGGTIMEEAWEHIISNGSIQRLRVQVRDLPGDKERRLDHERRLRSRNDTMVISLFGGLLFVPIGIVLFFHLYWQGNRI